MAVKQNEEQSLWSVLGSMPMRRVSKYPRRYMEIFKVMRKYRIHLVFADIERGSGGPGAGGDAAHTHVEIPTRRHSHAEHLASAFEELGPCFIKLGQLLSTRPDLLPPGYVPALSRLQDRITSVPADEVVEIIEGDLGAPIATLFKTFDREPLATASMAQVHRATLPDGTELAVKVLRPGVRAIVEMDLQVMREITTFLTRHTRLGAINNLSQMVDQMDDSLRGDMDFLIELENTRRIKQQISEFPMVDVPVVYEKYSSSRVLTESFIKGKHLSKYTEDELKSINGPEIARQLLSAYLKQIVVDGLFHADPHPGNILMHEDGRLVLLDFGMVGRFDMGEKDDIVQLLLAFAERHGEHVADTFLKLVEIPESFDRRGFTQAVSGFVSMHNDMSGGKMGLGTVFLDLARLAESLDCPVPGAFTLLSKTMLNLDGVVTVLSPELDPVGLIRQYMMEIITRRVQSESSAGTTFSWSLDLWHLVQDAPRRANTLLGKLANDEFTVKLDLERLEAASKNIDNASKRLSRSVLIGAALIAGGHLYSAFLKSKRRNQDDS